MSIDVRDLETDIRRALPDDPGRTVAVTVIDPATDSRLDINGHVLFHAASTMKIPVMIEVFRRDAAGRPTMQDGVVLRNAFRSIVDGSPYTIEDDT
ncbi:MAG: serine hydrolase, partial [Rhodothermales bacterium]|nr:serine hydrolase [Rhodothermales bacterium]